MTSDNVILNKVQTIRRCLERIREEYDDNPDNLKNLTKQDAIILNLQRACEASIDLAMHVVADQNLGLPQSSRQAFDILEQQGILSEELAVRLKSMGGFRNIAVHDYQRLSMEVVRSIISYHLDDFRAFCEIILQLGP
ncbi:MAG: DUF86 domain-containing protein [Alicyclobacillus herbarius]|uniref:type VII toxin-antitoxin system HepT family RNase toxin n=1 Tax=Alicyclobacillus herbarius TaxID=122960 RepID=UPI0023572E72|nr:DUF86 domain-containing protein [Alicyclobacillus herbarius]MCL6632752.1 DUF86 domain-containing protein [Alicyclobacillus herbarius]